MILEPHGPPRLDAPEREAVHLYFEESWSRYEWLFSSLLGQDAVLVRQPHPFRNALAFYYGHSAAFYVQKLRLTGLLGDPVDERLDHALERGVWPTSSDEIKDHQSWPDGARLRAYRHEVHGRIEALIEAADFSRPVTTDDPLWALFMGIEHERIHFQTTVPLIRQLPTGLARRPEGWRYGPTATMPPAAKEWVQIPEGPVQIGRDPREHRFYGWDNEYGQIQQTVPDFRIRSRPITNSEMLAFVEDGGYADPRLWRTAEAAVWFEELAPTHPAAWVPVDGGYRYRAIFDELDMPPGWPAVVNRHEAAAFATWVGARLPTEAEFHRLLALDLDSPEEALDRGRTNVDLRWGSPVAVGSLPGAVGRSGVEYLGNVALWAHEDFGPLDPEGFQPHPCYPDFSEPWFRGDHGVLLGAGFAASGHLCQVAQVRDFMQNHMDQIAGILLVEASA